mmetsp:Transcript_18481/g.43386  ORF Transcript_18481/g.43386 Transcript_18481/m.43386 type:complete len:209 (-) Transcript_18481:265-891(-)
MYLHGLPLQSEVWNAVAQALQLPGQYRDHPRLHLALWQMPGDDLLASNPTYRARTFGAGFEATGCASACLCLGPHPKLLFCRPRPSLTTARPLWSSCGCAGARPARPARCLGFARFPLRRPSTRRRTRRSTRRSARRRARSWGRAGSPGGPGTAGSEGPASTHPLDGLFQCGILAVVFLNLQFLRQGLRHFGNLLCEVTRLRTAAHRT